ncbi:hypothetical protein OG429_03745 [Streptomyces sp. NBC_00190]|uniref:hypothetical protein n=1 Tax=unclassified Streptomyces TaxID=2593676 RepID=UPI002E2B47A8|nr:hypothetical protein [Streptomyces sp. NBC_00190]WSZ38512.1 hypothetical protein OG239_06750 [Streptomyces sp. NBC_00868]
MDDQGGAGGAPLHGHDDEQRRRAPHVARKGEPKPTIRAAEDEASRLDRPGQVDEPVRRPHRKGPE